MKKNKKMLFLAVALVTVLILVSAVNATNTTDKSIDNTISEKTSTTTSPVVKEKTTPKEKLETNKNNEIKKTNKTDKTLKEDSITIDGVTYTKIYENQAITADDFTEDWFGFKGLIFSESTYMNNCTITGSGDSTEYCGEMFSNINAYISNSKLNIALYSRGNYILNNSILNSKTQNYGGTLSIYNSTLNSRITNDNQATLIIDDLTTFGENFSLNNAGTLIMNNTDKLAFYESTWNGDYTFQNVVVNSQKTNRGNVTFINSTLNSTITNNGNMTISDDTVFGENFVYSGTGNLIINDTSRIIPYMSSFNGFTLENVTFNKAVSFDGENTLINCTFEDINAYEIISNSGNLTIINSTIKNCTLTNGIGALIRNNGIITVKDTMILDNIITSDSEVYGFINNQYGSSASLTMNNITFSNNKIISSGTIFAFINSNNMNINQITDSRFENNTITKSIGDYIDYDGIILYNLYDTTVTNCIFNDNNASAISGSNVNITNSTFKNNKRTVNSRTLDTLFANPVVYLKGENNIIGCQFIDNSLNVTHSQAYARDLHGTLDVTNALIKECIFSNNLIESNSIWTPSYGAAIYGKNLTIENNNFTNNQINTPAGTYSSSSWNEFDYRDSGSGVDIYSRTYSSIKNNNFINTKTNQDIASIYIPYGSAIITNNSFANTQANNDTILVKDSEKTITDNTFNNCSIGFKTLELTAPTKVYSNEDVTVTLNIELACPDNYDEDLLEKTDYEWYVNGENTTSKDTSKTVSVGTSNVIVYVTPTVSNNRTRVLSLIPTVLTDVVITPENINNYLVMGELQVNPNSKVIFQGEFTNIGEINNNKNEVLFDGSQATFTNTYFVIEGNDNTIQNMNINNKDTSNYIIQTSGNNTVIQNNILTQYNSNGQTAAIKDANTKNTVITQNIISVAGPAKDVASEGGVRIANTQAILSKNTTQSTITYNNITITNSTNPELAEFTTIEAITAPQSNKNQISYNNIQCTGARFNYAIDLLNNVEENEISYNDITVTGYRYCDGIQVGDGAINNLIANNNIEITCLNDTPVDEAAISYGIIVTSQGGQISDNNTITRNNIEINGIVNYGIEIYTASNTPITDNTITLNGAKSMGIGYAHSPNSTVTGNTINTNDDSSIPINGITEEIQPLNTGILTQQDSDNILIENNTIQTYDKQGQDTCIKIESSNVTIKNNNLTSSTQTGDNTITTTQPDTTLEDNNAIEQNSTTQTTTETLTIGDSTTLTAQFYDDTYTPTGDGKAIFKVNGKTLRDDQGNVIYADVINGRAELPDVNITQEWTKEGTTIQAVYVGDDNNAPITTKPTTINVTKPEATITIEAPTEATAGTTITLKATVTDGENNITSGRVAFKLNGKTLKDPKTGKALYANVENGEATITYTIPEKTKAKEYVLTAVFTDSNYDRKEAESKLNVVKP